MQLRTIAPVRKRPNHWGWGFHEQRPPREQVAEIGGGTTEMARNNIAEKVLKMPREITHDKNMPFRDVPKGPPAS